METRKLFEELQSKLILDLKDNETPCPKCKGLRMTYEERNEKGYVVNCNNCYTGKLYICNHCGETYKTMCNCQRSKDEKEKELMDKAKVVKFSDYNGHLFSLHNDERIVDVEDFEDEYIDTFDADSSPKYVWASKGEPCFGLDIYDIISNKTEDGYNEMYSFLDMESALLSEVQDLLDKWIEENKEQIKVYYPDKTLLVDLTELYERELKTNL